MMTPKMTVAILACVLAGTVQPISAFELPMEAESFRLERGWQITDSGYFAAQPNFWSRAQIVADESDQPARASLEVTVPAEGTYALWVRYESCAGFGSVFKVQILQAGQVKAERVFGRKLDQKYFPFGYGQLVQGLWYYHNTDHVYQGMTATLDAGPATIAIAKDQNESPGARRYIDLLYLTDDLKLVPGNDWHWTTKEPPPILSRFTESVYLRARIKKGPGSWQVQTSFCPWFGHGPMPVYYAADNGLTSDPKQQAPVLAPGQIMDWQKLEVPTVMIPALTFTATSNATVVIDIAVHHPTNLVKQVVVSPDRKREIVLVSIGLDKYEKGVFYGQKAVTVEEFLGFQTMRLDRYQPPGKPATNLLMLGAIRGFESERTFQLAVASGINGEAYACNPNIFGTNAPWKGFNTTKGFTTLQNEHLTRACYEGDYTALEKKYQQQADQLHKSLGRDVPQHIKLIEETGPPDAATLFTWPKVKEQFAAYLQKQGLTPADVEKDPDQFFYDSHRFRSWLFARVCADATRLIEKLFPAGTKVNSGSFNPSVGGFPTVDRGDDPFLLFRERGVTEFSSEISWGLGGTPDYIGPQTESYEAALARALSKYNDCPMGSYLIADGHRGYTGNSIELASYALYSQGFQWLHYYDFGWTTECGYIGFPEILEGIKRINRAMGAVENDLATAHVLPARIAVGWSSSTDIWDLKRQPEGPHFPGNCVYPQERQNLYLMLRHLQYPVDILSEEDLTDRYLGNYGVYFLVGDHLRPEAAEALRRWVETGGTLIAVAGGGLLDHYNKPLDTLKPVFGISDAVLRKEATALRPKLELVHAQPLDMIRLIAPGFDGTALDVYGYRQHFVAQQGKVIGTYRNGEAAVVENSYGKGKAVIFGALPGAAYLKPAIPVWPFGRGGEAELTQFFPTQYSAAVAAIFRPFLAEVPRPVACDNGLVEPVLLKGRNGYVVPLINYSGAPVKPLRITVDLAEQVVSARATFSKVKLQKTADRVVLEIPRLDKFDCLVLKIAE